jgi:hypothetical protein
VPACLWAGSPALIALHLCKRFDALRDFGTEHPKIYLGEASCTGLTVGTGEREEPFDHLGGGFRLDEDLSDELLILRNSSLLLKNELGCGPNDCYPCPEFMRTVGREPGNPLKRGLQPLKHVVQGLNQLAEFIVRRTDSEVIRKVSLANALRSLRDVKDRLHGPLAKPVAYLDWQELPFEARDGKRLSNSQINW